MRHITSKYYILKKGLVYLLLVLFPILSFAQNGPWEIGAIGGFIAFIASTIIYLDSISQHHKLPAHPGAQEIIEEIKHMNRQHALDTEVHRSEEHLQLQILRETRPIQEDIHLIKEIKD